MRILGVDPGSRYLGYGLVDSVGTRTIYVGHGVIRATQAPLAERLERIFVELSQVIEVFRPRALAVEGVFAHKNARSALILGHARGVVLLSAARAGLPVFEYAPARVKRSVGAGGNDSKDSVARMVSRLLVLKRPLERADAYDALAVACCHAHHGPSVTAPRRGARARFGAEAALRSLSSRLKPNVVKQVEVS
jgi:crossover junction endodeoxyribonuclease RuvC